jgi:exopolysaccharide biosynthesis protein
VLKKYLFLFNSVISFSWAVAQNDSQLVVKATWGVQQLSPGVCWKYIHFEKAELFHTNQNINVIEIAPAAYVQLKVVHSDSLETTSQLAKTRQALAAVNGSFFKMRGADPDYNKNLNSVPKMEPAKIDRNRSIVYLRESDSLISENIPDKSSTRKRHQAGSIAINDSTLFIVKGDSLDLTSEYAIAAHDVLSTGPVMILSGIEQPIPDDAFCNDRHPRTAVGKKPDGTVVLLVVDGRASEAAGMSIHELKDFMKWMGCVDAINLDGGGSSTMYIKGQEHNGVVNYPADNKKFDHEGEREVANAILIIQR